MNGAIEKGLLSSAAIPSPAMEKRLEVTELTATSAVQQVASIAELLEHILLYLADDIRILLLCQRTSKAFQATICSSTKLQRSLFFMEDRPDGRTFLEAGTNLCASTKILREILLYTDDVTISASRQVNKTFRATINSSDELLMKLHKVMYSKDLLEPEYRFVLDAD